MEMGSKAGPSQRLGKHWFSTYFTDNSQHHILSDPSVIKLSALLAPTVKKGRPQKTQSLQSSVKFKKLTEHTEKQENEIQSQEKEQPSETDPEMTSCLTWQRFRK
jgi:hypothetical protein